MLTEKDAHVIGRDVEVAEAIYTTDFKRVQKYMKYAPLESFGDRIDDCWRRGKPWQHWLEGDFSKCLFITSLTYRSALSQDQSVGGNRHIVAVFLSRRGKWIVSDTDKLPGSRDHVQSVNVYDTISDVCRLVEDYKIYRAERVVLLNTMRQYLPMAIADRLDRLMDEAIADRRRWLATIEAANETAKRRIAQVNTVL